ncbi:MAG: nucleotide exchange factor GrpE, partial [Cyanobacteria bacterium J06623_7]
MTEEQKQAENLEEAVENLSEEQDVSLETEEHEVVAAENQEQEAQSTENEEIFAAFQQENANLKQLLDDKSQQADLAKAQ